MYTIQFLPLADLSDEASIKLDVKDLIGSTDNKDWISWSSEDTLVDIVAELMFILNTGPINIKGNYFKVIYEE